MNTLFTAKTYLNRNGLIDTVANSTNDTSAVKNDPIYSVFKAIPQDWAPLNYLEEADLKKIKGTNLTSSGDPAIIEIFANLFGKTLDALEQFRNSKDYKPGAANKEPERTYRRNVEKMIDILDFDALSKNMTSERKEVFFKFLSAYSYYIFWNELSLENIQKIAQFLLKELPPIKRDPEDPAIALRFFETLVDFDKRLKNRSNPEAGLSILTPAFVERLKTEAGTLNRATGGCDDDSDDDSDDEPTGAFGYDELVLVKAYQVADAYSDEQAKQAIMAISPKLKEGGAWKFEYKHPSQISKRVESKKPVISQTLVAKHFEELLNKFGLGNTVKSIEKMLETFDFDDLAKNMSSAGKESFFAFLQYDSNWAGVSLENIQKIAQFLLKELPPVGRARHESILDFLRQLSVDYREYSLDPTGNFDQTGNHGGAARVLTPTFIKRLEEEVEPLFTWAERDKAPTLSYFSQQPLINAYRLAGIYSNKLAQEMILGIMPNLKELPDWKNKYISLVRAIIEEYTKKSENSSRLKKLIALLPAEIDIPANQLKNIQEGIKHFDIDKQAEILSLFMR